MLKFRIKELIVYIREEFIFISGKSSAFSSERFSSSEFKIELDS